MELTVSPDFRFLTRDLMDSQVDPIQEQLEAPGTGERTAPRRSSHRRIGKGSGNVGCVLGLPVPLSRTRGGHGAGRDGRPGMHAWAQSSAEAAACAQEQGNGYFWKVHDFLFPQQRELNSDNLRAKVGEHVRGLPGFDADRFASCLAEHRTAKKVEEDVRFGAQIGIHATPTLFRRGGGSARSWRDLHTPFERQAQVTR